MGHPQRLESIQCRADSAPTAIKTRLVTFKHRLVSRSGAGRWRLHLRSFANEIGGVFYAAVTLVDGYLWIWA
jgi:hypothetical protein